MYMQSRSQQARLLGVSDSLSCCVARLLLHLGLHSDNLLGRATLVQIAHTHKERLDSIDFTFSRTASLVFSFSPNCPLTLSLRQRECDPQFHVQTSIALINVQFSLNEL
jgi:hypothetical protein